MAGEKKKCGEWKYFIVDFKDGPQIVSGSWMTKDRKYCAWQSHCDIMDRLGYDRFVQDPKNVPDNLWNLHEVLRIRACGDSFSKIRLKLRDAEYLSQTDLNSAAENDYCDNGIRRTRRRLKGGSAALDSSSSEGDDGASILKKSTVPMPPVPKTMVSPSQSLTFKQYEEKLLQTERASKTKDSLERERESKAAEAKEDSLEKEKESEAAETRGDSLLNPSLTLTSDSQIPSTTDDKEGVPQSRTDLSEKQQAFQMAEKLSNTEFKAYLILSLTQLRSSVSQMNRQLSALSLSPRAAPVNSPPVEIQTGDDDPFFGLPALDMKSFVNFNEKLKDKTSSANVVAKLKEVCSFTTDLEEFLRKALSCVLSNSLASEFSYKGARGKAKFEDVEYMKILKWMVSSPKSKDSSKFKDVSTKSVSQIVGNWLRLAGQRQGGLNFKKYRASTRGAGSGQETNKNHGNPKDSGSGASAAHVQKRKSSTPKKVVSHSLRSPIKKKSKVKKQLDFNGNNRKSVESDSSLEVLSDRDDGNDGGFGSGNESFEKDEADENDGSEHEMY